MLFRTNPNSTLTPNFEKIPLSRRNPSLIWNFRIEIPNTILDQRERKQIKHTESEKRLENLIKREN